MTRKSCLRNRRHSAAYYVAGYVVECALKACLAKKARRHEFPPKPDEVRKSYYTHDLQDLAKASGLLVEFEKGRSKLETIGRLSRIGVERAVTTLGRANGQKTSWTR